MQTRAPDAAKIAIAVAFALSCFALLLFLWVSFGGPTPFRAQSYRFTAYFPEATQLGKETDVRISGVSVGKVKSIALAPAEERINGRDLTAAVIEIEPRFAPVSAQARAILRQKTLLGETYVELAPGGRARRAPVALGDVRLRRRGGDDPRRRQPRPRARSRRRRRWTRSSTRSTRRPVAPRDSWVAGTAASVRGRALDLNDSLGNLAPFVDDAARITRLVRGQRPEVARLIRDGGAVLAAISRDESDLRGAIAGTEATLGGLADANEALAESIQILPTFEQEATLTLARLDDLQRSARPVIRELLPVADDVPPTLRSARRLAPSLRRLFVDLDPVLDAAGTGLPATRRLLAGLGPLLDAIDPLLANLNPVIRYLYAYRNIVTAFLTGPPLGVTNDAAPDRRPAGPPPLPADPLLHQPRDALDPSGAPGHQPRQRLRAAARLHRPPLRARLRELRLQEHRLPTRQPGSRRRGAAAGRRALARGRLRVRPLHPRR